MGLIIVKKNDIVSAEVLPLTQVSQRSRSKRNEYVKFVQVGVHQCPGLITSLRQPRAAFGSGGGWLLQMSRCPRARRLTLTAPDELDVALRG